MRSETKIIIFLVLLSFIVVTGFFAYRHYQFTKYLSKTNTDKNTQEQITRLGSNDGLNNSHDVKKIAEVRTMLRAGKVPEARKEIQNVLNDKNSSELIRKYFKYFELLMQISSGLSLEQKLSTIDSLKKVSEDTDFIKWDRANALNNMMSLYTSGFEDAVFNKIFEGEYSKFSVKDNKMKSIAKLGEYSYEIYPTTSALLFQNYWCNVVVLDPEKDVQNEKKECLAFLANNIEKIDRQMHLEFNTNKPESDLGYFSALHRKAFVEAAIALKTEDAKVKATYTDKFQKDYEAVLDIYKKNEANPVNMLSVNIPYSHLYYAAFLYEIYGSKKLAQVNALTDTLVAFVQTDNTNSFYFKNFVREQLRRKEFERDHNYRFIAELSKINKKFSDLVRQINK